MASNMPLITLPGGERVPAFGLGTWQLGEQRAQRAGELAALRLGLDRGACLIDTAEMYGDGASESLVGEAIRGRRDEVFVVTKIFPHNATRAGTPAACDRSLSRLQCDVIDLYLLHWRGNVPLEETLEAFSGLRDAGKIRYFGVSNFDRSDLEELWQLDAGREIVTNQILYNLKRRAVEVSLAPWLRQHHVPVMAYSPIEQAALVRDRKLIDFAGRHDFTPAQAALGWLLQQEGVIAIPRTSSRERMDENLSILDRPLTAAEMAELDALFPRPAKAGLLEML